jgi:hypothetical protein
VACRAEPTRAPGAEEAAPPAPAAAPAAPVAATPPTSPPARPAAAPASAEGSARTLARTFDADTTEAVPPGFTFARTGVGLPGKWIVQPEAGVASGNRVLAQLDGDSTNFRFPLAVANEPVLKDVRVSVRCKLISGRIDQACGLVVRYLDENNYFITRANALEDNIRLYTVKGGKRSELASSDLEVTPNVWHEYRLELRGDHLQVFWNEQRVLDHRDGTFAGAGRVGVWTKADSVTLFDDLRIENLE